MTAVTHLEARGIRLAYGDRPVLEGAEISVARGEIMALVGPNGSGKSTLLRVLSRAARPGAGTVILDGEDLGSLNPRAVARRIAVLHQRHEEPGGILVRDLVGYGRFAHRGLVGRIREEDREAVGWAIAATGLEALADRPLDQLSGGESQRAWLAMALAQRTGLLLLDEPTTFLDLRHQIEVLSLVRRLNREHGVSVVWVLHDLNQAAAFSDRIAVLSRGRIVAHGPPETVLDPALIARVFGVETRILRHPETGHVLCLPIHAG